MIQWQYFPKSAAPTALAREVVHVFEVAPGIDSQTQTDPSDKILAAVAPGLKSLGFAVETGKRREQKISVPVLFGRNGRPEKSFDADAHHVKEGFVVEVEAGRGVVNNQFLKDLFQACMMHDVFYLAIAVRLTYSGGGIAQKDFEIVCRFFDTLFASERLKLPLRGILVIGY
jgi:hypothetical protein